MRISVAVAKSGAKSGFNEPGREKPIETAELGIGVRQMAGQGAQIAVPCDDFVEARDLRGLDRDAAKRRLARSDARWQVKWPKRGSTAPMTS